MLRNCLLAILMFMATGHFAEAQTNKSRLYEVGFTMGPYLPSEIKNVTEILPFSGLIFSHPLYSFRPEYWLWAARSDGVNYYLGAISFRNDLELWPGMYWAIGYEHHQYQPYDKDLAATQPFVINNGMSLSFGFFIPENTRLRFRTIIRLGTQEGRSAYVGLGLTMMLGGGTASAGAAK